MTSPNPNCRIGRIKFHNGAHVRVITKRQPDPESSRFRRAIVDDAHTCAKWDDMAGYIVMCWDSQGRWTMAYDNGFSSPVRYVDLARFVGDRVREQATMDATIEELNQQGSPPKVG